MFPLIVILPARNSTRFLLWLRDDELLKRLIFSLSCLTSFNATKATQVIATIYQRLTGKCIDSRETNLGRAKRRAHKLQASRVKMSNENCLIILDF